jgi:DNA-binding transcriptional LysR family regulator
MTLDQLEMVEAIIEEGTYQAAAKKLHKSQPSLSTGVKKIEQLYGIQLFSRESYRPQLTQVGRRFFEEAKLTLSCYRELHKLASELGAGVEPQLKLSVDPVVPIHSLKAALDSIYGLGHKTSFIFESGVLFDNAHKLLQKKIDLAVGHLPLVGSENLDSKHLCTIELLPVIHPKLCREAVVTKELLQHTPNIVVRTEGQDSQEVSSSASLKWYVDSHARKTELISLGMGWGRVSRDQWSQMDQTILIDQDIVEAISLDIHLMKHKLRPMGPVASILWNYGD